MDLPQRKQIRLQGYDYSTNGAYFITMCVEDGHEILAQIVGAGSSRPQENVKIISSNYENIEIKSQNNENNKIQDEYAEIQLSQICFIG